MTIMLRKLNESSLNAFGHPEHWARGKWGVARWKWEFEVAEPLLTPIQWCQAACS
ncbi:MAG: hypothetical protein ACI8RE_002250 [Ilumatobacter sp.]|jgi:hypothetical protein